MDLVLKAEDRETVGKSVKGIRDSGKLPIVAYGHGVESTALTVATKDIEHIYQQAGSSKLIGLKVGDGRSRNALIHDTQFDPVTGRLVHADLLIVRMDEVLKAEVPLHFIGETPLVYQQEGILVKGLESIEVECLPANLPEFIER